MPIASIDVFKGRWFITFTHDGDGRGLPVAIASWPGPQLRPSARW